MKVPAPEVNVSREFSKERDVVHERDNESDHHEDKPREQDDSADLLVHAGGPFLDEGDNATPRTSYTMARRLAKGLLRQTGPWMELKSRGRL